MARPARQALAPLYLLACLLLGGSAQGIWSNALLQLVGLGLIAWAAASRRDGFRRPARQLTWIFLAGLAVVALQLVPLPASVWPHLGGRCELAANFRLLKMDVPTSPISLAPYTSITTLLTIIPPVALFCAIARLKAYRPAWLAYALLAGTFAGILLGALQVASARPEASPWYLYPRSSLGVAAGFFANGNHMATLLVISLPFLAALLSTARRSSVQRYSAVAAVVAGAGLVIVVGIALNGSIAGYGLAIPVLAASLLILVPIRNRMWRVLGAGSVILLLGALAMLAISPVGDRSLGTATSVASRGEILATTGQALRDFLPLGSGLGTFPDVYRLYEDHDQVTTTVINHAHNDYAELALELGVPGVILILAFFVWWLMAARRVWRSSDSSPMARAATIASAAILVHSMVDFPLRTAAIGTCFAMCLALMVERRRRARSDHSELWPTRHVTI